MCKLCINGWTEIYQDVFIPICLSLTVDELRLFSNNYKHYLLEEQRDEFVLKAITDMDEMRTVIKRYVYDVINWGRKLKEDGELSSGETDDDSGAEEDNLSASQHIKVSP